MVLWVGYSELWNPTRDIYGIKRERIILKCNVHKLGLPAMTIDSHNYFCSIVLVIQGEVGCDWPMLHSSAATCQIVRQVHSLGGEPVHG
jgi:hypothetical protein